MCQDTAGLDVFPADFKFMIEFQARLSIIGLILIRVFFSSSLLQSLTWLLYLFIILLDSLFIS